MLVSNPSEFTGSGDSKAFALSSAQHASLILLNNYCVGRDFVFEIEVGMDPLQQFVSLFLPKNDLLPLALLSLPQLREEPQILALSVPERSLQL